MKFTFFLAIVFVSNAFTQEFPIYAKCEKADYQFIDADTVQIDFQGSAYKPQCITVKVGTKVILPASNKHPLQAAQNFLNFDNPFFNAEGDHLTNQERILEMPGFVGYYCTRHADAETGNGMGGMIQVIE